jgi:RNA polymerase sigma-70 factor (ECF subfamily)
MEFSFYIERAASKDEDDAQLVEALRRRQSGAATLVYRRHVEAVHALLFRWLGPKPDVEDLLQEVFVSAFVAIDKLREPRALRAWLIAITVRRIRTYCRRRRRNSWLSYEPLERIPEPATCDEEHYSKLFLEVRSLLDQLPADERAALVLHRVHGLSLRLSAKASGMSISTFKRRLSQGETRLFARAARREALAPWLSARDSDA